MLIKKKKIPPRRIKKKKSHQEDVALLHTYTPNTRAPKFIKQTQLKLKSYVDPHKLIWKTPIQHSTIGNLDRKIEQRNAGAEIINKIYVTYIYRICHIQTQKTMPFV